MPAFVNLTGHIFGRLTVLSRHPEGTRAKWICRCSCGNETVVTSNNLRMGRSQSCGCLHKEQLSQMRTTHGHNRPGLRSKTYGVWSAMLQRCENQNNKDYHNYGARGVSVCERWHHFENFLADMGQPAPGFSLDRFPNQDGNYEPANCRWATPTEQCRNVRSNRLITLNGETHCIAEWAEIKGTSAYTISSRLSRGWSEERAINTPT